MHTVVIVIIVVNVLISLKGFSDRHFFDRYKFQVGPVANKDWIRVLSSGFLHGDYMHLFFNMFTLYIFADGVIGIFGAGEFVVIYFLSLLAGNYLSYYFHKNDYFYSAVGASAAVMGVVFAFILLFPFNKLYIIPIPIPIPAILLGVGYLAYSIFGMKNQWGNLGHAAHIGGAAMGLVVSVLFKPELIHTRTYILVFLVLPLVLLYVFRDKLKL